MPTCEASQATSKILEKSDNLSTSACPIHFLISENALAIAALHRIFFFFQVLSDWGHYSAETANKSSVEHSQTMEASDLGKILGHWPVLDSLYLCRISLNTLIKNYKTQKLDIFLHEQAFVPINIKLFSSQNL